MRIGLDVGSTTLKCVVLDSQDKIVYKDYQRHFSQITAKTVGMLDDIMKQFPDEKEMSLCISGSAGMGIADSLGIPFEQEVYATRVAVNQRIPGTDVVIELGGEDAKILFLTDGLEVRMNGSCAGGTGAFIDQMATLLGMEAGEMNEAAKQYDKVYTIASRCGVFAKSDVQPLLNQGAQKNDISASIFYAVVNQTIAGLAQGREIEGKVVYLGGPLTFLSELRRAFDKTLKLEGIAPEDSLYFVAIGAALKKDSKSFSLSELREKIDGYTAAGGYVSCKPLFTSEEDYEAFLERHKRNSEHIRQVDSLSGLAYLGIDAGSTTVKAVVVDEDANILRSEYLPNGGNPVPIIKNFLEKLYDEYPDIRIGAAAVTGYGEEMIMNAFGVDFGIVETVAHFTAAKKFQPDVDFIIDIGGQDIKCFQIRNNAIDNIFLNEACSSGCGSFLQTFAGALGYPIADFARLGLFADKPVDLGSRCTVFMNSSVKQAQKDGATIENISAGLSISVVKNALYKVIRAASARQLGEHIVVQGGTFLNNAVLRAFEQEIGHDVVRPEMAGIMGAYGAALYARENSTGKSTILDAEGLAGFKHEITMTTCNGCNNHCKLTVNTFDSGRRFISGNRCDKPTAKKADGAQYDLYDYKLRLLEDYRHSGIPKEKARGTIGIPMGLNMYELLPFWYTLFTRLGFNVVTSPNSSRSLYLSGQHTIPSDTVCFPAKLMHGHIEALLKEDVDAIFYPCLSYNFDEGIGDNHYNCPVVAYYPEVLEANVKALKEVTFIYEYLGIHRRKDFTKKFHAVLEKYFGKIKLSDVMMACNYAYDEHDKHMRLVRMEGRKYLRIAKREGRPVIVLAGRPYHLDPEINHGISKLICDLGAVVVTEDSVSDMAEHVDTKVLNQWMYHSRMYAAAQYVADEQNPNLNLVQLVSFGCGVDAITTDEVRRILEEKGKIYTQIKIDEITNLGAVKIRLRSLFAATKQKGAEQE
ncbi:MAG: acyl-CoA dehydratase activase-related protein [Bacteroidales bacterium]|nr:acyl-CoA dehydratase activase-related protein [Clostridium sp.]MCM1204144.1 acyl-CoA dehydratase activase-related protein [Bacteroidales bacterium]